MILIIGGAYQGKLDYAVTNYGGADSVFQCMETSAEIDFSKRIINSYHLLVLAQLRDGTDALGFISDNIERLKDKIIICDDISSGVVPVEREARLWREANGRGVTSLAAYADEIIRVFCGIGLRLK